MHALVYHGRGRKAWEEAPDPEIIDEGDAIVRVDATTICGTEQWARDITITTGLVDASSTPTLMRLVASGQLDAARFVTHRFDLNDFEKAYDVFGNAAASAALKVVLTRSEGGEGR
jgi:threonine dehydrogenase-like Zn-dependent dehydrogenase